MKLLWHKLVKPINLCCIQMSLILFESYCRVFTYCNIIIQTVPYFSCDKWYLTVMMFKPEPDMHFVPFGNSTLFRFQLFLDHCPSCLAATYLHYRFDYFDYRPFFIGHGWISNPLSKNGNNKILDLKTNSLYLIWR